MGERLAELALPLMPWNHRSAITRRAGTIIRAMAARLKAGTTITPHTTKQPPLPFGTAAALHVPITTNRKVRFMIDGRPHRMTIGHAYEINNQKRHGVINGGGDEGRITFIFDYIPGPARRVTDEHGSSKVVTAGRLARTSTRRAGCRV